MTRRENEEIRHNINRIRKELGMKILPPKGRPHDLLLIHEKRIQRLLDQWRSNPGSFAGKEYWNIMDEFEMNKADSQAFVADKLKRS